MRRLGMPMYSQSEWLTQLQSSKYAAGAIDIYGQGGRVAELEKRIATLLNKPAALFFTKGTIAQLCALKVAAEKAHNNHVVLHGMSHIVLDEEDAYQTLAGLKGMLIGDCDAPFELNDITGINEKFATLVTELPIRRAGFKLSPWEELCKMNEWCKQQNVHFHMDGARLWESASGYNKSLAEISELYDSVYVSLYKGLGANGGAVLLGSTDFIASCKVWRSRFGGNAFTSFPMIIGALEGLDNRLQRIPEWVKRAKEIASLLSEFSELEINTPHTNGFFVFLSGDRKTLSTRAEVLNQKFGIQLFSAISTFPNTSKNMIEIQVGAHHHTITNQEVVEYFTSLLA